jgi:hypothetical protein
LTFQDAIVVWDDRRKKGLTRVGDFKIVTFADFPIIDGIQFNIQC